MASKTTEDKKAISQVAQIMPNSLDAELGVLGCA